MMAISWNRIAMLLMTLGIAGCAGFPQHVLPGSEAREVTGLLARFDGLVRQSVEEQRRELAAAHAAFDVDPSEINRLWRALALSAPLSVHDDAKVIGLVSDWPEDGELSLSREVAILLYRQAVDRQKILKEEQRRVDGLRDELRRTEIQLREDQRRAEIQLREEHKKFEELQQKLEALRAIDRETRRAGRH
jgi:hypothetical protein